MKRVWFGVPLTVALCCGWSVWADHESGKKDGHVVLTAEKLQWGPSPNLPPGAMVALLSGDPTKEGGIYALRVKLPDGYKVPPHWHSNDENVTVLQGSLLIGAGDKFDPSKMDTVPTGGFMHMPKQMHHFAMAKGDTVLQLHGMAPFDINYINPSDDPRKK